jgi:hypothetical protein
MWVVITDQHCTYTDELCTHVSGKPLIKKHHSTYKTEVFRNGGLGVHFYKNIVPLMEPSNWSRVYSSPTNKVISAHFTRNNGLLVGHLKQCLKDLGF